MRTLIANEIEMVHGGEVAIDSYLSSVGLWGTFGATVGSITMPLLMYFEPMPVYADLLLALAGQNTILLYTFAGTGAGFVVGATLGVGFYYFASNCLECAHNG